jgi:hypothetical protein
MGGSRNIKKAGAHRRSGNFQERAIHACDGRENVVYFRSAAAGATHASANAFGSFLNLAGSYRVAGQSPSWKLMAVVG